MGDPGQKGTGTTPASGAAPPGEADEFARIRRARTRHPLLALGAGVLALFLVVKMRADIGYFLSSRQPSDLGDARALLASDRGRGVLAEGTNRLVRVAGTPDRESALQVDTRGSWTFTQFFKILGTDARLFVHRRESPLPADRAEKDLFEGRLIRFNDLSFEDSIRAYFAAHVSTTHFFSPGEVARAVRAGGEQPTQLRDLAGDAVVLGGNDILAIDQRHPGEIEVALPITRFADAATARAALVTAGATVMGPGRALSESHSFVVRVDQAGRDRVLDAVGNLDPHVQLTEVRETVKARLGELAVVPAATADGADQLAVRGQPPGATPAPLANIATIRTLATVQIPDDAYLIAEAETPREHTADVAIALVLLVFAAVNLVGLARGLRP